MNATTRRVLWQGWSVVDGLFNHVQKPPQDAVADRDGHRAARVVVHRGPASQPRCFLNCDAAGCVEIKMLLNFKCQRVGAFPQNAHGSVDFRQVALRKSNIHDRA